MTERPDDALDAERVDRVRAAVAAGDAGRVDALLDPLHAADIADLLEQIAPFERRALLALWSGQIDGEVLSEIDEAIRDEVVEAMPAEVLAEAVRELDTDDVVDLVENLDGPEAQEAILAALDRVDRAAVEAALAYPEYSAGRLMQREVVVAPEHWTVGDAIDFLRGASDLPDQFYHVILVDPRMAPKGYVTLGRILSAQRNVALTAIAEESFRTVAATESETDVAYVFNQYHLISLPVVDAGGRLAGVITIDDAMAVLDEEHAEDMLRLAHVGDEASVADGPLATVRRRLPWLVVNLGTASLSALVISAFGATIEALVALAALMPIVASTGGIAGTQSLAIAVRGLATRDLTAANARRVVIRELAAGALNGVVLACIIGLAGALVLGDPRVGAVLGLAMIVSQVVAALGGVIVPLTMDRLGIDPALASATFVTTLTDVVGFLAFLGLATLVLL
jgi:magnesium transporter